MLEVLNANLTSTKGGVIAINSDTGIVYYSVKSYARYNDSITLVADKMPDETNINDRLERLLSNAFISAVQREVLHARVFNIQDGNVEIEVFLPKGKLLRALKGCYIDILRKKELLFIGAEFDIAYTVDDDGTSTKILESKNILNDELKEFYDDILNNLE